MGHIPVLKREVIDGLVCLSGGLYVDGTLGEGGHTEAILEATGPGGRVLGIDQDPEAIARVGQRLEGFGERLLLRQGNFIQMKEFLQAEGWDQVDGILLDLGVSSNQLDDPARGFSFKWDGPLDMRMDPNTSVSASDLVNDLSERDLSRLFWRYGEERWARSIARAIVKTRQKGRLDRTLQLAEIVRSAIPPRARRKRIHPATQTFQALRIMVNGELEQLNQVLQEGINRLRVGARFCVISYHSLEDRTVKEIFRRNEQVCQCPPDFPECVCGQVSRLRVITRKPVRPGSSEIHQNPRSRSAKLRVAEKK
jgi:16S rRNA (cytosine1402-N4)-methyltransferase